MKKIFIKTLGCSNNFHESEVIAGLLSENNLKIVDSFDKADICIVNICTVKGDNKALREIKKFKGKKVIVAGCINKNILTKAKEIDDNIIFVNTHNMQNIVEVINKGVDKLTTPRLIKINLPKKRKNKVVSIIPISTGCLSSCSYCSVKLIKGELFSYPKQAILDEVKQSVKDGCKEIWITAQDSGAYMMEKQKLSRLPSLIKDVTNIEGDFIVRIGMINPQSILDVADELVEIFDSDKVFKFLHLPVQSGSDKVLKDMNRGYKVRDFINIVNKFRRRFSKLTLSTDVIVGYPTETGTDFEKSVELIKKVRPAVLNISKYVAREGTRAYSLKQISSNEMKRRSKIINEVFSRIALEQNKKWAGWSGEILIDEKGKANSFVGRNFSYKPIIVFGRYKLGSKAKVRIDSATTYDLRASYLG